MADAAQIAALAERVEMLDGPDSETDARIWCALNRKRYKEHWNSEYLGGLQVAREAYKLSLNGQPAPVIDGFTGDQRFYLSYGQIWKRKTRDEALRNLILADPHAPPQYRVNGVVRNHDAWYEAFNVQAGDKLYLAPADRVVIW